MPIRANQEGTCPHCQKGVQFLRVSSGEMSVSAFQAESRKEHLDIYSCWCPTCSKIVLSLAGRTVNFDGTSKQMKNCLIWPRNSNRPPAAPEVPAHIGEDYNEAATVLPDSAKASAALSRRCLQTILLETAKVKEQHNLSRQIEEVLPTLPSYISKQVDAIRTVGNFSAHPLKSEATGEIIEVEPGEAEWNLDTLDLLFDHYYVKPTQTQLNIEAQNKKLEEAGKNPLKSKEIDSSNKEKS